VNYPIKVSLMKQQFVVTHTICQTEILALLDSSVTNAPSIKILCPQKNGLFHKCLTLRLLTSYIYGAPILDVSRSHTTTQHSR